jgi:uncharacterized membrane protein
MKRRRILAVLFLLMGLANLLRAGLVPEVLTVLEPEMLSLPLPLLGGLYGLFGLGFIVLAILSWLDRAEAWGFPFAVVYQLVLWIIRFIGYRSPFAQSLWARDLLLTLLFLVVVFVLNRTGQRRAKNET